LSAGPGELARGVHRAASPNQQGAPVIASLTLLLSLAAPVAPAADACTQDPPSRASSEYWEYVEDCGCERVDPPSRASLDYRRFQRACSRWRERNPRTVVVTPPQAPEVVVVVEPEEKKDEKD
jgi:hypothetical protein